MLQERTVEPKTLELLENLMLDSNTERFALAGGTALSLQLSHRISVDLDFFTKVPFNAQDLYLSLKSNGFELNPYTLDIQPNTLNCHIQDVKVQFLGHFYNQVTPFIIEDGIRLYALPDIAAMKLNAITNRGAKKDFWDYAELLNKYSLMEMLSFYQEKYDFQNFQNVLKSLSYFDDAEKEKNPICLNGKTWANVKKATTTSVKRYFKEILEIKGVKDN